MVYFVAFHLHACFRRGRDVLADHVVHVRRALLDHGRHGAAQLRDGGDARVAEADGGLHEGGDDPLAHAAHRGHAAAQPRLDTSGGSS